MLSLRTAEPVVVRKESMVADDEDDIGVAGYRSLGGVVARGLGARRGGWGAAWTARRLPKNVHEITLILAVPVDQAITEVITLLERTGQVITRHGSSGGDATVRAITGGGAMNLNPVVITVTTTPADSGGTAVHIRGAAKEGLIKQRAGEKAAQRFATLLGQSVPCAGPSEQAGTS
jgi:hypothetical protein